MKMMPFYIVVVVLLVLFRFVFAFIFCFCFVDDFKEGPSTPPHPGFFLNTLIHSNTTMTAGLKACSSRVHHKCTMVKPWRVIFSSTVLGCPCRTSKF